MNNVKTSVRIIVALLCFYGAVNGQTLTRRQQMNLQRQQNQVEKQQELLEKQLLSQAIVVPPTARDQSQPNPIINHAVLDSIFNVPIQAIKAVNELIRTLAAVRARLSPNSQISASLTADVE